MTSAVVWCKPWLTTLIALMKLRMVAMVLLVLTGIKPAQSQSTLYFEECDAYGIQEKYSPGYYNEAGRYVRGGIRVNRERIPCGSEYKQVHYPHHNHQPTAYPYPYPPQKQPIQQTINTSNTRCDKLSRVGLLSLGGGIAGRYIAPSNKTILGTSIGAISGALLGSQLC